jgi:Ca2+-binding RTX toxin-like protein
MLVTEDSSLNSYTTQERPLGIAMPELLAISAATGSALLLAATLAVNYPDVIARENNISAYSVAGEFLTDGWGVAANLLNRLRIKSTPTPEFINIVDIPGVSEMDLHSQALLIAAASAPDLVNVLQQMPALGAALYDKALYARAPSSTETDFLIKLVQSEYTVGASRTGFITGYVSDMKKLTESQVQLGDVAKKALIAQAMDWYYAQSAILSQSFFLQTSDLLQYTTAQGDGLPGAKNKSANFAKEWLTPLLNADRPFGGNANSEQWNVSTGTSSVTATARNASKTQIFVGNGGADLFTGGDKADVLLGGDGADQLDGGAGSDHLYGGAGSDTYAFAGDYGNDWITDSDGQGVIKVNGQDLPSSSAIRKVSDSFYYDKDTGWGFTKINVQSNGTADLVIQKDGSNGNSITIRNWQNGLLGITLNDTQETAATGLPLYIGDQRPLIYGTEISAGANTANTYAWDQVSRDTVTGNLTGQSTAQANFSDVLTGSLGNDDIRGLGGNDALSGGEGNDLIDGGTGDDLIGGGLGQDTIQGGDGNDQIFSGLNLHALQAKSPSQAAWAPPAGGTTVASGPTWGAYKTADQQLIIFDGVSEQPQDALANQIDGGAGNDYILAGFGNDHVDGGADDDDITGLAGNDILLGGSGADTILGDGPDAAGYLYSTPASLHGNDVLDGGNGNDILFGQGGQDELYGDANDDQLWGDDRNKAGTPLAMHDNDYLDGGSGNDTLTGGGKDDDLFGGEDNDLLLGDDTSDKVDISFHGQDYLDGEDGADTLTGGGNNDELFGGTGNDILLGDDTQDRVAVSAHGQDYLDGEDGDDKLLGGGNDDELFGGIGNDSLWGDDSQDLVLASAHGNDYLDGEAGDDQLAGGGKNDTLVGGTGNDTLWGDDALSLLAISAHGDDDLDGGDGNDVLLGGAGNDTLAGGNDADTLFGEAGDDTLDGGSGSDRLYGGTGKNLLMGDEGEDMLSSESTGDTLVGGVGNDTFYVELNGSGVTYVGDHDGNNALVLGASALSGLAWAEQIGNGGTQIEHGGAAVNISNLLMYATPTSLSVAGQQFAQLSDLKQELAWHITGGDANDTIQGSARGDTMEGGSGNDLIQGAQGSDDLYGQTGDDTILGQEGNDYIVGGAGLNRLEGGTGDDVLQGGEAGDHLIGGTGDDLILGGHGNDVYEFNAGDGADAITDFGGQDEIRFGTGLTLDNLTASGISDLSLLFSTGEALVIHRGTLGVIEQFRFADGHALTVDELIRAVAPANGLVLDTPEDGGTVVGGSGNDSLQGLSGDDTLIGLAGNDVLSGGAGNDTYLFQADSGTDTVIDQEGVGNAIRFADLSTTNNLHALLEYVGDAPVLVLRRSDTGDEVRITNAESHSIARLELADGSTVAFQEWLDTADLARTSSDGNNRLQARPIGDTLSGLGGNDTLVGDAGADALYGGAGDDVITGASGADTLVGDAGRDTLMGGDDTDTYIWGTAHGHDSIVDASAINRIQLQGITDVAQLALRRQGQDLLVATADGLASFTLAGYFDLSTTWTLVEPSGQEFNLSDIYAQATQGSAALIDHGRASTAQATFIERTQQRQQTALTNMASGWLRGIVPTSLAQLDASGKYQKTGLSALNPNQTIALTVDASTKSLASDDSHINLTSSSYWDTRRVDSVTTGWVTQRETTLVKQYIRPEPVMLRFIPIEQFGNASGGIHSQQGEYLPLYGGETGQDILGYFQMKLPDPTDVQVVWRTVTSITTVPQTTDTYVSELGLTRLAAGDHNNDIAFTDGNVIIDAGAGNDSIHRDNLTFSGLRPDSAYQAPYQTFLYGNEGNDTVIGSKGADELMGGTGDDMLNGGAGADTYRIDVGADWDTIMDTGVLTFSALNNSEFPESVPALTQFLAQIGASDQFNIPLTAAAWNSLVSLMNSPIEGLWGGQGYNFIGVLPYGSALTGIPLANDQDWLASTYIRTMQPLDVVQFGEGISLQDLSLSFGEITRNGTSYPTLEIGTPGGGGVHVVLADADQAIGFGVERFRFDSGEHMTLADMLFQIPILGTPGNDRLEVAGYRSRLQGGAGNDIYVVNNPASEVIEQLGEGNDTIETPWADFTLEDYDNVENLTLTQDLPEGDGSSLRGNDLKNKIIGANSDDWIDGLAGDDVLEGRGGSDELHGEDGKDTLNGGSGADVLVGGAGNDTYIVDDINDVVIEGLAQGKDSINTSISLPSTPDNVETIVLTGSANLNATGHTTNNTGLVGNNGNNFLVGGAGFDILSGGFGIDTLVGGDEGDYYYLIDEVDTITEDFDGAGIDVIFSMVENATMATNVEYLWMKTDLCYSATGSNDENWGFGNNFDNELSGMAGDDHLYGRDGDDRLSGGLGNDELNGGIGNDSYLFQRGDGGDTISDRDTAAGNVDVLAFSDVSSNQIWFQQSDSDLVIRVIGTEDAVVVTNWYGGTANQIEQIQAGGETLRNDQVQTLVQAMSAITPPATGQLTLSPAQQAQLAPALQSWAA